MHNDNSLLHDKVQLREREGWGESEFETQATSAQARRVQLDDVRRQFCLCRRTHYLILLALYAECRTNKSIVCISVLFFFFNVSLHAVLSRCSWRAWQNQLVVSMKKKKSTNDSQLS